jgi:dienelactone hydrolase
MESRPHIVCLCGSARFAEQFRAVNRDLTLAGAVVVAPAEFEHANDQITDEQKAALGALHLAKIDLADRAMVINPGGYDGESTQREIHYAHQTGKPVE